MKIETECGTPVHRGWYREPDECGEVIIEELDSDTLEDALDPKTGYLTHAEEGAYYLTYDVECPKCTCLLEWPQMWTVREASGE